MCILTRPLCLQPGGWNIDVRSGLIGGSWPVGKLCGHRREVKIAKTRGTEEVRNGWTGDILRN